MPFSFVIALFLFFRVTDSNDPFAIIKIVLYANVSICSKIAMQCLSNCKEGQIAHIKIYKILDTQQEYTDMS